MTIDWESDISHYGGQFCPDCGARLLECKCAHRGNTLPAVPRPRYNVGDIVYRKDQDQPSMRVLDRICHAWIEAECDDGYDGHSAVTRDKISWRYLTTCHWRDATSWEEADLTTRAAHLPWVVWYYLYFSKCGREDVRKALPDVTDAEIDGLLAEFQAAGKSKKEAERVEKLYGVDL